MNNDLTVGSPQRVLWRFCLPLFASIIFQQLYNIADSLVAGKFVGEAALAAVGNSYEITLIFIAFAFGCNIGCSVVVSQLFGAKDYRQLRTAVYTAWIASGLLTVVLTTLGLALCGPLLRLIRTPQEIFSDSALYLRIYIGGLVFLIFYNIATGIFSALGDSRTPFLFLAASSVSNIFVDILFVTAFKMGVAGVAWATFLCQGISCVLAIIAVLRRLSALPDAGKVPLFSVPLLRRITVIAVPSILQQSFISVGNIVIQATVNGFGSSVIAGYSAAVKLNNMVVTSFTTLGNGISNYTAQNIGAARYSRVRQGFWAGLRMVWVICVPLMAIYLIWAGQLVGFFMDEGSARAITTGTLFLRVLAPFYPVVSAKLVSDGILRGAGAMGPFMAATFTDLLLRVVLALVFASAFGETGIWFAWPVGWLASTAMSVVFYRHGSWHTTPDKAIDLVEEITELEPLE